MWVLSENERLRFVKDSINTTRKPNVTLQLDCMPTITAGMVEAVEAQAAVEAEAKLNAEKPTIEGMIMTDRPDLYSDKWSGDTYTGSNWNELTGLLAVGEMAAFVHTEARPRTSEFAILHAARRCMQRSRGRRGSFPPPQLFAPRAHLTHEHPLFGRCTWTGTTAVVDHPLLQAPNTQPPAASNGRRQRKAPQRVVF